MKTKKEIQAVIEMAENISFSNQDDIISPEIIYALKWVIDDKGTPGNETDFIYDPSKWSRK